MEAGFKMFSYVQGWVDDLDGERSVDYEAALSARNEAYAPYSNFFMVGASLRMGNGRVFTGWNSETISYDGVHAEESARGRVDSASRLSGLKRVTIVGAPADESVCEPTAPCGACRQKLLELSCGADGVEVVMASVKGRVIIATLNDLLPFAFFPKDLLKK